MIRVRLSKVNFDNVLSTADLRVAGSKPMNSDHFLSIKSQLRQCSTDLRVAGSKTLGSDPFSSTKVNFDNVLSTADLKVAGSKPLNSDQFLSIKSQLRQCSLNY